ncbi:DUF86 domain-containing protein [Thermococcus aggregans]|uniref:DUF86 domain-containing protein n=2 Tax=Thermococcus TaxID=2263 RepID=A0A9E7MYC5_THEAG|nr:DUF86 domain-containing protein [Thermococcus aggregans]USS41062.1 DUF86 domain-containing protein [Thermococcus aggregans]HHI00585.1 DUF86 domain-containing protein [Thermococcus litoralis]
MSKRDYRLFLEDMLEAVERIEEYTKGYSFEDFINDRKTIDAVVRNLEILGEAARNIPEEIRKKYQEIPWKRIVGLRNVVIHQYFGVDLKVVWVIISSQLPQLKDKLVEVLKSEGE